MVAQTEHPFGGLESRAQLVDVHRLGDEVVCARLHALEVPRLAAGGRYKKEVGIPVRRTGANAAAQLGALDLRHLPVRDDDGEMPDLERVPRLAAMLGFRHLVTESPQHCGERHAGDGIVFCEQQVHCSAPGRIRTSDQQLRRLLLYPPELRAPETTRADGQYSSKARLLAPYFAGTSTAYLQYGKMETKRKYEVPVEWREATAPAGSVERALRVHPREERNPGTPLDLDLVRALRVNRSAVERRAATIPTRRTVKREWQAAWLLRAITCIDLTTLQGDDTPTNVLRLCAKAKQPVRQDLLAALDASELGITVGAVCVYHAFVPLAVEALQGSAIPVAAVSTGFPAGLNPLPQRIEEIKASVAAGAQEIDVVITRAHALAGAWEALYDEVRAFREACGDAHMKVILGTGDLATLVNVARITFM